MNAQTALYTGDSVGMTPVFDNIMAPTSAIIAPEILLAQLYAALKKY